MGFIFHTSITNLSLKRRACTLGLASLNVYTWFQLVFIPTFRILYIFLFLVYTEALQGMFSFQCWPRISFLPVWYVLQQTCLLKSYAMKRLPLFIRTHFLHLHHRDSEGIHDVSKIFIQAGW